MKYEYHLKYWGQVQNDNWIEKDLGIQETDFWFSTKQDREAFKQKLESVADKHSVIIAFDENEGTEVRKKTIAKITFTLKDGTVRQIEYDFGYAYPPDAAYYMFNEGSYSCDCNRSIIINETYDNMEELDCGETIRITSFVIEKVDQNARESAELIQYE